MNIDIDKMVEYERMIARAEGEAMKSGRLIALIQKGIFETELCECCELDTVYGMTMDEIFILKAFKDELDRWGIRVSDISDVFKSILDGVKNYIEGLKTTGGER